MELLQADIKKTYFKYFGAAFGSSLISTIYAMVDTAVVGHALGPNGTAALAVISPIWSIIFSLGLMMGVGGSVLYGTAVGGKDRESADKYFTISIYGTMFFSVLVWICVGGFGEQLLLLCGADEKLLPMAMSYLRPIQFVAPSYLITQTLFAFLRNDNNPGLATAATLAGGVFNIFGDLYFVFGLDLGMFGAGLATAGGGFITLVVCLFHFVGKKNTLRLVRVRDGLSRMKNILTTGFPSFVIDVALGVVAALFNRQIMDYAGTVALSVYGVIAQLTCFVQCSAYGAGQAAQPLFSANFGAGQYKRVKKTLKYASVTAAVFGLVWISLLWICPLTVVRLFMAPTPEVLELAPSILRTYGISYLLLPFNIFITYYFQSILKARTSFVLSLLRGIVLSGGLILLLPAVLGADAMWWAIPITEVLVAAAEIYFVRKYTRALRE